MEKNASPARMDSRCNPDLSDAKKRLPEFVHLPTKGFAGNYNLLPHMPIAPAPPCQKTFCLAYRYSPIQLQKSRSALPNHYRQNLQAKPIAEKQRRPLFSYYCETLYNDTALISPSHWAAVLTSPLCSLNFGRFIVPCITLAAHCAQVVGSCNRLILDIPTLIFE